MSAKSGNGLTAFGILTLCELTLSAMVLPRPPSSPNEIPRESMMDDSGKFENEKALYSLLHLNTNMEKPNTDGYRLLEIELRGAEDVDETNLRGLVRAVLRNDGQNNQEDQQHHFLRENLDSSDYPNPRVVPNSILGVRNVGISSNYRNRPLINDPDERKTLESPEKYDKFYYLKNPRPRVDINVRGHSGSFGSDSIILKTGIDEESLVGISATDLNNGSRSMYNNFEMILNKISRPPKKYQSPPTNNQENELTNGRIGFTSEEYEPRPDKPNDESTTENMSVTSSELPKQIPAPPSRVPSRILVAQTTPLQKYALRRTDILPGYTFGEV